MCHNRACVVADNEVASAAERRDQLYVIRPASDASVASTHSDSLESLASGTAAGSDVAAAAVQFAGLSLVSEAVC